MCGRRARTAETGGPGVLPARRPATTARATTLPFKSRIPGSTNAGPAAQKRKFAPRLVSRSKSVRWCRSETMSNSERHRPGTASSRHALYGLGLPSSVLKALQKRGIYCTPGVSLEHQHLARRYVLRGVESGGAVSDMGRACAFVGEDGSPLPWLQAIDSIAVNGRHAILLAESMVRIEMLRSERTWELAITHHALSPVPERTRPQIVSKPLFRGRDGVLCVDLWKE